MSGMVAKHSFTYPRYADDLAFSGDRSEAASQIPASARRIISDEDVVLMAGQAG
jgi:hypothetical protein